MRRRVTALFLFFSSLALHCIEYNVSSIELITSGPLTLIKPKLPIRAIPNDLDT